MSRYLYLSSDVKDPLQAERDQRPRTYDQDVVSAKRSRPDAPIVVVALTVSVAFT